MLSSFSAISLCQNIAKNTHIDHRIPPSNLLPINHNSVLVQTQTLTVQRAVSTDNVGPVAVTVCLVMPKCTCPGQTFLRHYKHTSTRVPTLCTGSGRLSPVGADEKLHRHGSTPLSVCQATPHGTSARTSQNTCTAANNHDRSRDKNITTKKHR